MITSSRSSINHLFLSIFHVLQKQTPNMLCSTLFGILSAVTVMANPIAILERQSGTVYCGNTYYTVASIDDAVNAGCNYLSQGQEVDSYPHQYNDYEGFNFPVSGPYYEFPLEKGYAYDGGA